MELVRLGRTFLALIAGLSVLAGCSSQKFGLESQSRTYAEQIEYSKLVDVLLVVDTSDSMAQHQDSLASQASGFVAALDQTGLDYQIAVTTMDMGQGGAKGGFLDIPSGTGSILRSGMSDLGSIFEQRIRAGEKGATVERGLQAMKSALSAPNTETMNKGFLRDTSLLVAIFLSNEEDQSVEDDYIGFLNQLKPPLPSGERSWIAHFIGVLPGSDTTCKTASWGYRIPGLRYIELAKASGGRTESICTSDLTLAVNNIKKRIIEIATEYALGDRRAKYETIKVYINDVLLPESEENGWTFNADRNSLTFHGTGVPGPGSTIHVDFDPEEIL